MTDSSTRAAIQSPRGIFYAVFILTVARTAVNMTRRFTYTFVPTIARGLGVSTSSVQNGIALQSGIPMLSPLFGSISERFGRKYVLVAAQLIAAALGFIGAVAPVYGVFLAVMLGFGFSKMLFDTANLAYLGDRVPYNRRAAAIGINELSWGAALLIAAPLTGLLLDGGGLRGVFLMLGVANLLGTLLILFFLPGDRPAAGTAKRTSLAAIWKAVSTSPVALGAVAYSALNSAANEMIFINYGAFMEQSFALPLAALGALTIAISVAEGVGEVVVAGVGDRLGPKRLALLGGGLAALCYALFPLFSTGIPVVAVGIFLMFLGFELAVVAAIPLYTEALPSARAAMMGAIIGGGALGRLGGGLFGAFLFNSAGITVNSIVACGVMLTAMTILWRVVNIQVGRDS